MGLVEGAGLIEALSEPNVIHLAFVTTDYTLTHLEHQTYYLCFYGEIARIQNIMKWIRV